MSFSFFLRSGLVYVPTPAKFDVGIGTHIEPVDVVPVSDSESLRRAFNRALQTEIQVLPTPDRDKRGDSVLLKYARVKTWGAFARNTSTWSVGTIEDGWRIESYRKGPRGSFLVDKEQRIEFPPETSASEVMDRMIAILQEKAGLSSSPSQD